MGQTKHTPEPWVAGGVTVWGSGDSSVRNTVADTTCCGSLTRSEDEANAIRIAACVNALAGMNPEAVAAAVVVLERIADELQAWDSSGEPRNADWAQRRIGLIRAALRALRGE